MDEKQKAMLVTKTQQLIKVAKRSGLLNQKEADSHMKLLPHDPVFISGVIKNKILSAGFDNLWKNHSAVMTELSNNNPLLAKFITRSRLIPIINNI